MFATLYILSIKFIVIFIAIISIFYVIKKPIIAFYILIFTFPFKNFYVWVGVDLQVWKFISIAFLIFQSPRWLLQQANKSRRVNKHIIIIFAYILYVFLITVLNNILLNDIDLNRMVGGYFKNEGRIFFQMIFFIITINLVFIAMNVLKNHHDILMVMKILFYGLFVLAILGLIQYFTVLLTGENPFPIYGANEVMHTAYIMGAEHGAFRINSWAGEPKHMAIAMVLGITIIILSKMNSFKIIKYDGWILALFLFNLLFTYSTTGYVWLGMILVMLIFIKGAFNWRSIFLIIGIGVVALGLSIFSSEKSSSSIAKQINRAGIEIQDETILSYLIEEPGHAIIGTGLGNIHHYSEKYLPSSFPLFHATPYKANSGILFILADYGLIGSILLYLSFFLLLRKNLFLLNRSFLLKYKDLKILVYFSFIISVLFLSRYNELFFIILGVLLALHSFLLKIKVARRVME